MTMSSLQTDRAESLNEYTYESLETADLIFHYDGHSYHLHSQVVHRASEYFKSILEGLSQNNEYTEPCPLSAKCRESNSQSGAQGLRCVKWSEGQSIGEQSITHSELNTFFTYLYDPSLVLRDRKSTPRSSINHSTVLDEWRSQLEVGQLVNVRLTSSEPATARFIPAIIESISANGEVAVTYLRRTGQAHSHYPAINHSFNQSINSHYLTRDWYRLLSPIQSSECLVDSLTAFLAKHTKLLKLAHYFHCPHLLEFYNFLINHSITTALLFKEYTALWSALAIADYCHFNQTITQLLSILPQDKRYQTRSSWPTCFNQLSAATKLKFVEATLNMAQRET